MQALGVGAVNKNLIETQYPIHPMNNASKLRIHFILLAAALLCCGLAHAQLGNTATGVGALTSNPSGTANTADGNSALQADTTGQSNTGVGQSALTANVGG